MFCIKPKVLNLTLFQIVKDLSLEFYPSNANLNLSITGVQTIDFAGLGEVSFISNAKYVKDLSSSKASVCVVDKQMQDKLPSGMVGIISSNPYYIFSKIVSYIYGDEEYYFQNDASFVSGNARVSDKAKIGKNVKIFDGAFVDDYAIIGDGSVIMQNSFIGKSVEIGSGSYVYDNCSVMYSKLGDNVVIRSGARIGSMGFGFAPDGRGASIKNQHLCQVIIQNNVDIGANTCIDRGYLKPTIIGSDTKIDNLVMIGHGVEIGKGCFFAGCSAIAGSTKIGDYVVVGGHSSIAGHLEICSNVTLSGKSGVPNNITKPGVYGGSPVQEFRSWLRSNAAFKTLSQRKTVKDDNK